MGTMPLPFFAFFSMAQTPFIVLDIPLQSC